MSERTIVTGWLLGAGIFLAITLVSVSVATHRGAKDVGDWAWAAGLFSLVWPFVVAIGLIIAPFALAHEAIGLIAKPRPASPDDALLEGAKREVEAIAPEEQVGRTPTP